MALRAVLFLVTLSAYTFAQDSSAVGLPLSGDSLFASHVVPHDPFFPPDSARCQPVHPRFAWDSVPGSRFYLLEVSSDSTFLSPVFRDSLFTDTTSHCDRALMNDSLYYWRVGWQDSTGTLIYPAFRQFTVAPRPSFSQSSCVFPPARLGESIRAYVLLRNPVADSIAVDSILTRSSAFRIMGKVPSVILPGDSLRFEVLFHASYYKRYRDTLVTTTSQGTASLPLDADVPPPSLGPSEAEVRFGSITIKDTAEIRLPVRNIGLFNDLSVLRVYTRTPFFAPSRETSFKVRPDDSMEVAVRFHVRAIRGEGFGRYDDTLTIVSDGGIAKIALRGDAPPPRIAVAPEAIDFGLVGALDSTSATFQIRNRSINLLRVDSIRTRSRVFTPSFTRALVSRSDTVHLTVRFLPDRYGPFVDTLFIYSNSWMNKLRLPMKGFAPYPILEADYERVNFGTVEKGDSGTVNIRLWNSSISFLKIDSIKSRKGQFRVGMESMPRTLRLGDAVIVKVSFFPDSFSKFEDTLEIANSSEQRWFKIPLLAEGIPSRSESFQTARSGTYQLFQNFPNPFNAVTTFSYNLPLRSHVRLDVFTTLGQRIATVAEGEQEAGMQSVSWEANLTSGVYYYRFYATAVDDPSKHFFESRKMLLLR